MMHRSESGVNLHLLTEVQYRAVNHKGVLLHISVLNAQRNSLFTAKYLIMFVYKTHGTFNLNIKTSLDVNVFEKTCSSGVIL